ncbi:hypothetical protein [Acinetobacter courvalinii]|uniref:hypothetical protein n=1 Tax=Acinetobacter courvalinii TaxID=280147 RepID=UPI0028A02068|nr:hypothetical protein [Acinetobacter courvalinii]
MVASTDIKFYVHTNTNAPQLQNAFGCMIDVLDACLVNGFGSQVVTSLVASGTTVTATFGTAHNFMQYQVIKISGANQPEFNGEHRILTVPNSTSITFQLAATPSATTATGTIACSLPALGWLKPFSGTGKAAYRSSNTLLASRPYLRVVDAMDPVWTTTYAKFAKVALVEEMSDIDTMFGAIAPFDSSAPDKNWVGSGSGATAVNGWSKWYYAHTNSFAYVNIIADSAAVTNGTRSWILVGNSDYFYILPATTPTDTFPAVYGFGAFKSLINNDTSNNFLCSNFDSRAANSATYKGRYIGLTGTNAFQQILLQRPYTQNAQYTVASIRSLRPLASSSQDIYTGISDYIGSYSLTNIAPFAPVFINETVFRGELFGFYWLFQNKPYANYQAIQQGNIFYIALNCASDVSQGQAIFKVGEI